MALRLADLARALASAGRQAEADGVVLTALTLSVAVTAPPVLDPARLWRLTVAEPRSPSGWRRWLERRRTGQAHPAWPRVRLCWHAGRVHAEIERTAPPTLS